MEEEIWCLRCKEIVLVSFYEHWRLRHKDTYDKTIKQYLKYKKMLEEEESNYSVVEKNVR
jgi:hypothetical protein